MNKLIIENFFDKASFTFTYLVYDPNTLNAVVIDPVADYDSAAVSISYQQADNLLQLINSKNLKLRWILETHVHADHLSAAYWLKEKTNAKIAIGNHIIEVQNTFNELYNLTDNNQAQPDSFDRLLKDGEILSCDGFTIKTLHTPGHTPTCCTYVIEDFAFVGDTLFMPDFGTARCDFPGGNAEQLFYSIKKILSLPDTTKLFMCHDYMPKGRELKWQTTVKEQKTSNIHINDQVSLDEFVTMRTKRDAQLSVPKLILPALQINIKAGQLPNEEDSGDRFIKLPINKF